ncbi:MAG: DNA helicase RecG, partial [Atribacterota bacterium]|nr:DNA helicase RecG [Atribacterota bacterium]
MIIGLLWLIILKRTIGGSLLMDFSPLRKILELERQKDYSDSAVFGGLDKFLVRWVAQVEGTITNSGILKIFHKLRLDKLDYASLDKQERKNIIEDILNFIAEAEKTPAKKIPVKTAAIKAVAPARTKKKTVLKTTDGTSINSSITTIKGVSAAVAARFKKLDVATIRDLLYFFPNRHIDYSRRKTISQLTEGIEETIIANVWQVREVRLGNRRSTEAIVGDETGNVRVVWFNNPYITKQLKTNQQVVISGRISIFRDLPVFQSPEWEILEDKELVHT